MGADALEDTKRAKEEMEVKTLTRMHSIGAPILELDPVVPPQNEFDLDQIDWRVLIYRLLIRGKYERAKRPAEHGH